MLLQDWEYDLSSTTDDLTYYPSSWKWNCDVEKQRLSELVTCTRRIANVADYETQEIVYVPQIVVNNIGYVWKGTLADSGSFEFGGQVTLSNSINSVLATLSAMILCTFSLI